MLQMVNVGMLLLLLSVVQNSRARGGTFRSLAFVTENPVPNVTQIDMARDYGGGGGGYGSAPWYEERSDLEEILPFLLILLAPLALGALLLPIGAALLTSFLTLFAGTTGILAGRRRREVSEAMKSNRLTSDKIQELLDKVDTAVNNYRKSS
ncbi:uncharacterized protein LOC143225516 [Tachypleus tridentatus]|uniref:uncharacterized protein LOC143225516 n=1 Tax=Tachypleus tridentatus TaxID=6853 RepID=UPI003FD56CF3